MSFWDKPWSVRYRLARMAYGAQPVFLKGQELPDLTGAGLLTQMECIEYYDREGVGLDGKPKHQAGGAKHGGP